MALIHLSLSTTTSTTSSLTATTMNHTSERGSPSPSSPSSSKLPKFLHKSQNRDRSRSMIDTLGSTSTIASSSSSSTSPPSETSKSSKTTARNSRKLFGSKDEKRRQSEDVRPESPASPLGTPNLNHHDRDDYEFDPDSSIREDSVQDDPPVIVEPVNIPRPRTRSDRPLSDNYPSNNYYPSSSSGTRIADLPTRLSGWFSHTFSTSATDLTLPALLSQQQLAVNNSPKGKTNALLTAAKHGQGHLSKAMRFLLDSDATPDDCTDSIWILGVEHPGYEPTSPSSYLPPGTGTLRRGSINSKRHQSPISIRSSPSSSPTLTAADPSLSQSQPASSNSKDPGRHWPPVFYSDFTSRIWLTYRSQFQPIRDTSLEALEAEGRDQAISVPSSPPTKKWNWPLGGEKAWSSDSGWGCMLRTGQSLLANTLLHLHLGRGTSSFFYSSLWETAILSDGILTQIGDDHHTLSIPPIMQHTCKF